MLPRLPDDRIAVASGLFAPADLRYMAEAGARCFLIEILMRQKDVASAQQILDPLPHPE